MSFEEKVTWVSAMVTVLVASAYGRFIAARLGEVAVADIAYQRPILWATGAMIVLTIVGTIAMAIGTAISAEITGEGSARDIDRKDERDVRIHQRGELAGYYTSSALLVGVLVLTMLELPHFWIANALFGAFVVGGLASATVKLIAYRRGF